MAAYAYRTPAQTPLYYSQPIRALQRIPLQAPGYVMAGWLKAVRMRGTWSGGTVFWDSLNGVPDTTGIYYPLCCSAIVAFSALTSVVTIGAT